MEQINKENIKTEEQILLERFAQLSFANLKKTMIQDLQNQRKESVIFVKYPIDKVVKMLENPQKYEKELRQMSTFLFITSSHYRRLTTHYAKLPTYNHIVVPANLPKKINKKNYKDNYSKVIYQLEKYNLKHEIPKMILTAIVEGVFYGLTYETTESFYIKQFDGKFADVSYIEDGVYTFSMDLNYFITREYLLPEYGDEIEMAYLKYKGDPKKNIKGNVDLRWFEPSNGVCIKADESNPLFSVPIFCSIFLDILRLEDYKLLKKMKTTLDNYKVLSLKMEVDEEGVPKMDFEMATRYYNQILNNVPDGIGVILSPFGITDFSFQKSAVADQDAVSQAEEELWASSGTSSLLFGSAKAVSSSSLGLSTKTDEQISFGLLTQVARYFNKQIKMMNLPYLFEVKFLDQSIFNSTEVQNQYNKAATYGVSGAKLLYASSLGMTPSDVVNLSYLENDILEVTETMFKSPLISSNTLSPDANDKGGKPTNVSKGEGLSESGEQTLENDENANK
ncbi:MAG: phage protein [Anaerocolumna sp.]|jgi:hypothetical protein|nr:phage protein [Anaerocolumna sp.]